MEEAFVCAFVCVCVFESKHKQNKSTLYSVVPQRPYSAHSSDGSPVGSWVNKTSRLRVYVLGFQPESSIVEACSR